MANDPDERLHFRQRARGAARRNRRVRQLARAVAADAVTGQAATLKGQVVADDRQDEASPDTSAQPRVIVPVAHDGHAILHEAGDAIQLVMPIARVGGALQDHVRRDVGAIGLSRIELRDPGIVVVHRP